jgi:glycosyltransferase involved in cell wall biosynthesis
MRIALITAHNPVATAATDGEFAQPASLARALAAHGHRVTVYARQHRADSPRTTILGRGVSVEHVTAGPPKPLPDDQSARHTPAFAGYLADRWRVRPPDVVHAFSWVGGLAALGALRGMAIPVLQTFGSLASAELRVRPDGEVSRARLRMEACIARSADMVLAGSSAEAEELARFGVPKSAIRVIPVGVDTDTFTPEGDRAPRDSRYRLIAVAPAGKPHGLTAVVRALTQLPNTELVVVGGPDARHLPRTGPWRDLCRLAAGLGVRGKVIFAGDVPEAELPALLRSADLMISAHAYEPSGMAAIRAMACGVPVVGTAAGAHNDAIVDGVTGLLVGPDSPGMIAQRVRALLARPVLLEALGYAAADRAQSRYALDRIGRETAGAYDWCLRGQAAAQAAAESAEDAEYAEEAGLRELVALG